MRHVHPHIDSSLSSIPEFLLLLPTACKILHAAFSFLYHSTKLIRFTNQSVFQIHCPLLPASLYICKLIGYFIRKWAELSEVLYVWNFFYCCEKLKEPFRNLRDFWDL